MVAEHIHELNWRSHRWENVRERAKKSSHTHTQRTHREKQHIKTKEKLLCELMRHNKNDIVFV